MTAEVGSPFAFICGLCHLILDSLAMGPTVYSLLPSFFFSLSLYLSVTSLRLLSSKKPVKARLCVDYFVTLPSYSFWSLINFHLIRSWNWGKGWDPRDYLVSAAWSACVVRVSVCVGGWGTETRKEKRGMIDTLGWGVFLYFIIE